MLYISFDVALDRSHRRTIVWKRNRVDQRVNLNIPVKQIILDWATFSNPSIINSVSFTNAYVVIKDKFVDSRGINKVRFVGGAEWSITSPYMYCATLNAAPDPVAWPGLRIFAGDLGSRCISNGIRYRLMDQSITLSNTLADIPHPGSFIVEKIYKSVVLPVDVNGKNIVDDGDIIQVYKAWIEKIGVANAMQRRYLIGSSITVGDYVDNTNGQIISTTDAAGSIIARNDKFCDILRVSNTTVIVDGTSTPTATLSGGGPSTTGHNTSIVTTTPFDSVTPPSLHITAKLGGLTDSGLALRRGYCVKLVRGY